jgi:hypothetical protein
MTKKILLIASVLATATAFSGAQAKPLKLAVRTSVITIQNSTADENAVSCNAGEVATGGGAQVGTGGLAGAYITSSKSVTNQNGMPVGWDAIVSNASGAAQQFTVYAVCQH